MRVIEHADTYRSGARVLFLKGRHKDGLTKQRTIVRITHSIEQFNRALDNLVASIVDGERVYGSVSARCMSKAIREFKRRQLDADYDEDPERFYRTINDRWASSLMQKTSQLDKLWMFDCDTAEEAVAAERELAEHYDRPMAPYRYNSKSGVHIILQPFDKSKLTDGTRALIHDNPIMLWAHG